MMNLPVGFVHSYTLNFGYLIYWYIGILWIDRIYKCEAIERLVPRKTVLHYSKVIELFGVPKKNNEYLCTAIALNSTVEEWVIQFAPLISSNRAHHMLLYGCRSISRRNLTAGYWNCGIHVCEGGKIMFAWTKNAPGINLPPDVGFRVGGDSSVNYLVLQIHYAHLLPDGVKDNPGLNITFTTDRQKYKAGVYLLEAGVADIPPLTPESHVDVNCQFSVTEPINIFGYRVHAHSLGNVIRGYIYIPNSKNPRLIEIIKGNPQWPQAFYPLEKIVNVQQGDILHARCSYNSSARTKHTYIGLESDDEMCNLYLMYYTNRENGLDAGVCSLENFKNLTEALPQRSVEPFPPNSTNLYMGSVMTYENIFRLDALPKYVHSNTTNTNKDEERHTYKRDIIIPGATPTKNDMYICTGVPINNTLEEWILLFRPMASANRVHHMLLFGCLDLDGFAGKKMWNCGHHGVCRGGKILYAWAKNAPATHLPDGVGFRIGASSGIRFLTLQIHYGKPLPKGTKDYSGVQLTLTTMPQQYKAGIFLLAAAYVDIPPYTEQSHADINCMAGNSEPVDINIFAYRVHTHKLGTVVSGYKYDPQASILSEIVKGNPQWPQAFYQMDQIERVTPKDVIHARCTYNSSNSIQHTFIGATGDDEMCNLYLMYYTDTQRGSDSGGCSSEDYQTITAALPPSSDEPLPPNPLLEQMTHGHNKNKDKEVTYNLFSNEASIEVAKKSGKKEVPKNPDFHLVKDWGPSDHKLGQITAVAVDSHGDVIIFHRGNRVWDISSFKGGNILVDQREPIKVETILRLQKTSGKVIDKYGANLFFMPHGLSVDEVDNIWVTDVGLHQVFKFASGFSSGTPLLSLGRRFEPGTDSEHFCKPTGVAVVKNGDFFVSDGYCNSRIIRFSSLGDYIMEFGASSSLIGANFKNTLDFRIPHALSIADDHNELCVADRENGRVMCFDIASGAFKRRFKFSEWGRRIFSVCYTSLFGGKLFALNGPEVPGKMVEVFDVDFEEGNLITSFSPFNQGFSNPHDLAMSNNGTDLYVVEIGPNKIWKFTLETLRRKFNSSTINQEQNIKVPTKQFEEAFHSKKKISIEISAKSRSSIFLSIVVAPVLLLVLLAFIMKRRKKGIQKWYDENKMLVSRLNKRLGSGGGYPNRKGFQKLSTNDFEEEEEDSLDDSEVEEFSVAPAKA